MITVAQDVARVLRQLDVQDVFVLCSDHTNSLLDALVGEGIRIIGSRHESATVHMADGHARATGRPSVAILGGGPGYVNAISGVALAHVVASPVVVISGQQRLDTRERNGHQILYQADLTRTITKWSQEVVSPANAAEFVYRAFRIGTAGKPGPVSLSIPIDVMDADSAGSVYRAGSSDWWAVDAAGAGGDAVARARELIRAAKRPMMIIGGGARWELERTRLLPLIRRLGIPVFTTELARGLLDDDGDTCFGYAHPAFNRTFREISSSDLCLLVGTEMNLHTGAPAKGLIHRETRVVQLHRDATQIGIGRPTDVALIGPLLGALEALAADAGAGPEREAWIGHIRDSWRSHRLEWKALVAEHAQVDGPFIHPIQLCESLERHYAPDIRVVIDGGDFVHWPRLFLRARSPGHWMDLGELGALGASLPLGIGAQLGEPARQTWVFIGDGGVGFYGFELSTAVEHELPLKVIVGNDCCWGVERRLQQAHFGRTIVTDLPEIDYVGFARSLGAKARSVSRAEELDDAVDEMMRAQGPFLLDVRIPRGAGRPLLDD